MPNRGDQIVKQFMRRNRWFVPAVGVNELAGRIVRAQLAEGEAVLDSVLEQAREALAAHMKNGEIKVCKRAGTSGYRKASGREVEHFRRRGLPSHKSRPKKTRAATRKRKVATALVT